MTTLAAEAAAPAAVELEATRGVDAPAPYVPSAYSRAILYGLNHTGRHVYGGTVDGQTKAARRKTAKAARAARRANR